MYINNAQSIKTHFLYPTAIFVSQEPCLITTILGSCVSVCLWDVKLKIGGMNHYMLPLWNGQGLSSPKYGNIAIDKLYNNMLNLGCNKKNLVSKLFGGAEIIQKSGSNFNIGTRNVELARQTLHTLNIQLISLNIGGKVGRKILFNTFTGEVKHKFIENK